MIIGWIDNHFGTSMILSSMMWSSSVQGGALSILWNISWQHFSVVLALTWQWKQLQLFPLQKGLSIDTWTRFVKLFATSGTTICLGQEICDMHTFQMQWKSQVFQGVLGQLMVHISSLLRSPCRIHMHFGVGRNSMHYVQHVCISGLIASRS